MPYYPTCESSIHEASPIPDCDFDDPGQGDCQAFPSINKGISPTARGIRHPPTNRSSSSSREINAAQRLAVTEDETHTVETMRRRLHASRSSASSPRTMALALRAISAAATQDLASGGSRPDRQQGCPRHRAGQGEQQHRHRAYNTASRRNNSRSGRPPATASTRDAARAASHSSTSQQKQICVATGKEKDDLRARREQSIVRSRGGRRFAPAPLDQHRRRKIWSAATRAHLP